MTTASAPIALKSSAAWGACWTASQRMRMSGLILRAALKILSTSKMKPEMLEAYMQLRIAVSLSMSPMTLSASTPLVAGLTGATRNSRP